jgi:hypothetical protein
VGYRGLPLGRGTPQAVLWGRGREGVTRSYGLSLMVKNEPEPLPRAEEAPVAPELLVVAAMPMAALVVLNRR